MEFRDTVDVGWWNSVHRRAIEMEKMALHTLENADEFGILQVHGYG